jgi:NADH-quinone oxidoreductase subunit C
MTQKLDNLQAALTSVLGDKVKSLVRDRGELSLTVSAENYMPVALALRDDPALKFEQLIDLCGVDYSDYKSEPWDGLRYCVVSHLLSLSHNWRVRLKVFAADDDMPTLPAFGMRQIGMSVRRLIFLALFSKAIWICAAS